MPLDNLNREARTAVGEYAVRALVGFVPGDRGEPASVSSGMLVATPAGRIVVLTAKHCARDALDGPVRLTWYRCSEGIAGTSPGVALHSDAAVDIGLFALWPAAETAVRDLAVTMEAIATDDVVEASRDALVVAGFPAALLVRAGGFRGLTSVNYGSAIGDPARDAAGRFRVLWTEMETRTGNVPMPRPHGISGGALWRFRGAGTTGVWSPTTTGRIIGVPVAWMESERVAFAEPVSKWRDWLSTRLRAMDDALGGLRQ